MCVCVCVYAGSPPKKMKVVMTTESAGSADKKPPRVDFFVEIFSGSGVLAKCFKRHGFTVMTWDFVDDPAQDMSSLRAVHQLIEGLKPKGNRAGPTYIHLAPPCNTFSTARFPKVRLGQPTCSHTAHQLCPVLHARSNEYPAGIPAMLRDKKVGEGLKLANLIVDNTVIFIRAMMEHGVMISIENPKSSYLWRYEAMANLLSQAHCSMMGESLSKAF